MFVHELCGPWMKHPFWRNRFLLSTEQDLDRLRSTQIEYLWIDGRKGLSAPDSEPAQAIVRAPATDAPPAPAAPKTTPLLQELERATHICARAGLVLQSMFSDVRLGRPC